MTMPMPPSDPNFQQPGFGPQPAQGQQPLPNMPPPGPQAPPHIPMPDNNTLTQIAEVVRRVANDTVDERMRERGQFDTWTQTNLVALVEWKQAIDQTLGAIHEGLTILQENDRALEQAIIKRLGDNLAENIDSINEAWEAFIVSEVARMNVPIKDISKAKRAIEAIINPGETDGQDQPRDAESGVAEGVHDAPAASQPDGTGPTPPV